VQKGLAAENFYGKIFFGQFREPFEIFFKLPGIKVLFIRDAGKMIAALTVQIAVFGNMDFDGE
jgi:hypothetical protein